MSEHKFEPFDRVLVRDGELTAWRPAFFASVLPGVQPRYETISGVGYLRCIPYTPETAHLLGTNAPYEPPKPPHEYKWGEMVEVNYDGTWLPAIFIGAYIDNALGIEVVTVLPKERNGLFHCPYNLVRPAAATT